MAGPAGPATLRNAAQTSCLGRPSNSPSPPVLIRSARLQPPSGPREGCDEFHDRAGASSRNPLRSMWPTMAAPWVLLVQLRQVRSSPAGKARPSGVEPVRTS